MAVQSWQKHFGIAIRAARHILPAGRMHWTASSEKYTAIGTLGKRLGDAGETDETGCPCRMNFAA